MSKQRFAGICAAALLAVAQGAAVDLEASLPSETPATFTPRTESFDHVKREVMIPMRDGVKLKTLILVPKGAAGAPMLLTRTPYRPGRAGRHPVPHLDHGRHHRL